MLEELSFLTSNRQKSEKKGHRQSPKRGTRLPEWGTRFPKAGINFFQMETRFPKYGTWFLERRKTTFLSCEIELNGKGTFGAPWQDELRGVEGTENPSNRLDSRAKTNFFYFCHYRVEITHSTDMVMIWFFKTCLWTMPLFGVVLMAGSYTSMLLSQHLFSRIDLKGRKERGACISNKKIYISIVKRLTL